MDGVGKVLHEIYGFHQHYNNPDWKNTDDDPSYDITLWIITDKETIAFPAHYLQQRKKHIFPSV